MLKNLLSKLIASRSKSKAGDPDVSPTGYAEIWGEHLQSARFYRSISAFLGLVIILLGSSHFMLVTKPEPLPIVVRVDDVGRAEVVDYNADRATVQPGDPVVPYFLRQFAYDHYQRQRAIGTERWLRSLNFLRTDVARQAVDRDRPQFVALMGDDASPERLVENVELRMVPQPDPPYVADMVFDLVYQSFGAELRREEMTVSLRFVFAEEISSDSIFINPMGLVIIYLEQQVTVGAG